MNVLAMAAIAVGCVLMAIGTFGLGFHTVGVIALGPSIAMVVAGAISALLGLTGESTPRSTGHTVPAPRRNPVSVHPNPQDREMPDRETPERVHVASWRDDPLALPPARSALPSVA